MQCYNVQKNFATILFEFFCLCFSNNSNSECQIFSKHLGYLHVHPKQKTAVCLRCSCCLLLLVLEFEAPPIILLHALQYVNKKKQYFNLV